MNIKIAVIVGSTRPNRVGRKIGDWTIEHLPSNPDVMYELIDLKEENLPFLNEPQSPSMGNYVQESTKNWAKKVAQYDGYILVTSEYNHGYAAPLKNALDTLWAEWGKKPVTFVGYGSLGGVRAIEQLGQVVSQLGMVPLTSTSTTVRILDVWAALDEKDHVKPENLRGSLEKLADDLLWWAKTLKTPREDLSKSVSS